MTRNIKVITAATFLAMLFMGVGGALVGAAAHEIGLTASQIGLLVAVQNLGFAVSVTVSGALGDTLSKTRILFVGSLVLATAFLAFYVSPIFWVNLGVMLLSGVGMGTYEGATDALLVDLHESRAALFININHLFVTLGALAIALYMIFLQQLNWRAAVVQSAAAILVLAFVFRLAALGTKPVGQSRLSEKLRTLGRQRILALLFVAAILAVGVEAGSISMLSTFLVEVRGFEPTAAKLGLVVLLAGMAAGRLVIGFLVKLTHVLRLTLALFGLAVPCFALMLFVDLGPVTFVPAFLSGMALSALLPLILTYAGLTFRDMTGTVLGAIKLAIPLGGIIVPLLMSSVNEMASLTAALAVLPGALLLGFALFAVAVQNRTNRDPDALLIQPPAAR
jgi:predicted MFS family arabinose efflux permease